MASIKELEVSLEGLQSPVDCMRLTAVQVIIMTYLLVWDHKNGYDFKIIIQKYLFSQLVFVFGRDERLVSSETK